MFLKKYCRVIDNRLDSDICNFIQTINWAFKMSAEKRKMRKGIFDQFQINGKAILSKQPFLKLCVLFYYAYIYHTQMFFF